jgi:hypothetical protein
MTRSGNIVAFHGAADRTGSTLSGGTTGNIVNNPVFTLTGFGLNPTVTTGIGIGNAGQMMQYVMTTAGQLQVSAMVPNTNVAVGETISFSGTYIIPIPDYTIAMIKL